MGQGGAGEKQEAEDHNELERRGGAAREDRDGDHDRADAERVAHGGGVHAAHDVREAVEADDRGQEGEEAQRQKGQGDAQAYHFFFSSFRSAASRRVSSTFAVKPSSA